MGKTLIERALELSSSVLSDALDSLGVVGGIKGVKAVNFKKKMFGRAYTIKYARTDKNNVGGAAADYIDDIARGSVIVIDNEARDFCTTWGNILTTVAIKRGIVGTVVNGLVRDLDVIKTTDYPLYSLGSYMQTGKGRVFLEAKQVELNIETTKICPGDWIFGDENGCVSIPHDLVSLVIDRAEIIVLTETRILEDVEKGVLLRDARKIHNYSKPWEVSKERTY